MRYPRLVLVALLSILALGCGCETTRIDPLPVPPAPVDPVDPKPPVVDPVDPNTPEAPAASWEAALKVQKGLSMAEVRAALGVDPAYSSADTTTGNVVSDYRIVNATGGREYLSVTFAAGVVAERVRIPRAK